MSNSYFIWFSGTSEKASQYEKLTQWSKLFKKYYLFDGWGCEPFTNTRAFLPGKSTISHIEGVKYNEQNLKKINTFMREKLREIDHDLANNDVNELVVGGFSRGSAVMVPFFLKKINEILTKTTSKNFNSKRVVNLTIFLVDPVTGSENKPWYLKNHSTNTLSKLNIKSNRDKEKLIQELQVKGFNPRIVFLSSGYDRRDCFILDNSFMEIDNCHYVSAHLGVGHNAITNQGYSEYKLAKKLNLVQGKKYNENDEGEFDKRKYLPQLQNLKNLCHTSKITDTVFIPLLNILAQSEPREEDVKVIEDHIAMLHKKTSKYLNFCFDKRIRLTWWAENKQYVVHDNSLEHMIRFYHPLQKTIQRSIIDSRLKTVNIKD